MDHDSLPSPLFSRPRVAQRLDSLPTEIILIIFSYAAWHELLTSWWSVNDRLDAMICSMFFTDHMPITLNERGLSFQKCTTTLLPTIHQSPALSQIGRAHV